MKVATVFVCALLVFGAVAVSEEEETYQTLSKIDASKFGKTILDTIQIQLASGDPVENLIELLKDIEGQMIAEQRADDSYIKDVRGGCEADENRLSQEISSTGNKIDELTAELNEKIPVRDEKTGVHNDKVAEAQQITDRIGELDTEKSERDAEWSSVAEEHDRATFVIESAKQMIERGFSGSFLEKSANHAAVFAQLGDHFAKNADLHFKRTSWNGIFRILATIASAAPVQADSGAIAKIMELADNLLE